MTRIVRAPSTTSPKTPKSLTDGGQVETSKNVFVQRGKMPKTGDAPVRRVMARDPADPYSRKAPAVDNTELLRSYSNPNPRVDPSPPVQSPTISKAAQPKPGSPNAGHQKVIKYNNQQRTGGKTLKRR